jgi:ABC-type multidrug transport system fused ATPase/permease subunit
MGNMTQEILLFHDSVEYNVAYGKAGATRAEIEHACRLAQAHDFITAFPDGYRTEVGERSGSLAASGSPWRSPAPS